MAGILDSYNNHSPALVRAAKVDLRQHNGSGKCDVVFKHWLSVRVDALLLRSFVTLFESLITEALYLFLLIENHQLHVNQGKICFIVIAVTTFSFNDWNKKWFQLEEKVKEKKVCATVTPAAYHSREPSQQGDRYRG